MKVHGAEIVLSALEEEGARFTFGIPGTNNIMLYDALAKSSKVRPILVTDEQSASFMADAVSRTSDSVGVVNVVPGAGVTHCLSGVAEAFMDNVPLVVLACGVRSDVGKSYQLHDIDQAAVLRPVCKAVLQPKRMEDVYPMVREAFALARRGTPGPVAVEIPADFYLLAGRIDGLVRASEASTQEGASDPELEQAARLLSGAKKPALYVGNGARKASADLVRLAERLGCPVTTSIQGKGVFPEDHPLWMWNGFGPSAPSFVQKIMKDCDCLLAIGCRFGEVATASYGFDPPDRLIHVDINPDVFDRNYQAELAIGSDAGVFVRGLLDKLGSPSRDYTTLARAIAAGHQEIAQDRERARITDRVSPSRLFLALQATLGPRAIYATDSGNGTFLAMEHLRLNEPGCFIGPVDYSCMGYSVPAAIGAKLANPDRPVVALAGDGAFLMTGLELLTAAAYQVAPIVLVLRDGELAQIAQFQKILLNRRTCTTLSPFSVRDLAQATRCEFLSIANDAEIATGLDAAVAASAAGIPVLVDVAIDYSARTFFTKGASATTFRRLPWGDRLEMIARIVARRLFPGPPEPDPVVLP